MQVQARKDGVPFTSRLVELSEGLGKIENSQSALLLTAPILQSLLGATPINKTIQDLCPWLSETRLPYTYHLVGFYFRKHNPIKKYIDMK